MAGWLPATRRRGRLLGSGAAVTVELVKTVQFCHPPRNLPFQESLRLTEPIETGRQIVDFTQCSERVHQVQTHVSAYLRTPGMQCRQLQTRVEAIHAFHEVEHSILEHRRVVADCDGPQVGNSGAGERVEHPTFSEDGVVATRPQVPWSSAQDVGAGFKIELNHDVLRSTPTGRTPETSPAPMPEDASQSVRAATSAAVSSTLSFRTGSLLMATYAPAPDSSPLIAARAALPSARSNVAARSARTCRSWSSWTAMENSMSVT